MLVTPSAANVWINLSTLSSITGSLVVTNTTAGDLFFYVGPSAPADSVGILCRQDEEAYLDNRTVGNSVWMKSDCIGPVIVQSIIKPSAQFSIVSLPSGLLTDDREGYARIRVDNSETSFFIGKQFRTFKKITLASGATYTIKVVATTDVNVLDEDFSIDTGTVELNIYTGATPTGTFTDTLPVLRKNSMSTAPVYASGTTITGGTGITLSGGTQIDVQRLVASSSTARAATTTVDISSRGIPPGTYLYQFTNAWNGSSIIILHSYWEER